jgi:hypothetical protein
MFSAPDRNVVYRPEAVELLDELPEKASSEIRNSIERFLDNPSNVLTDELKAGVHRIDCEPYRALATDCRTGQIRRELMIVQAIYLTGDEAEYLQYLDEYANYGIQMQNEVDSIEMPELNTWIAQKRHEDGVIVVSS